MLPSRTQVVEVNTCTPVLQSCIGLFFLNRYLQRALTVRSLSGVKDRQVATSRIWVELSYSGWLFVVLLRSLKPLLELYLKVRHDCFLPRCSISRQTLSCCKRYFPISNVYSEHVRCLKTNYYHRLAFQEKLPLTSINTNSTLRQHRHTQSKDGTPLHLPSSSLLLSRRAWNVEIRLSLAKCNIQICGRCIKTRWNEQGITL
jgi:hypothetical protein